MWPTPYYQVFKDPCEADNSMTSFVQMPCIIDSMQCHPTNANAFQIRDPIFVHHKLTLMCSVMLPV